MKYKQFIEDNLYIVDKAGHLGDFKLNSIQNKFLSEKCWQADILKARQQGFSSLITAVFFCDFLLVKNSYNVVIADIEDNAVGLLDKVKLYIQGYETKKKVKVPLKYNSRFELYNPLYNSSFVIGTSENYNFGRSKTITNLHLSEVAFYRNIQKIIAGCVQAVVEGGKIIFETTANGFNEYKSFRADNHTGKTSYRPLFYKASDFYTPQFLEKKKAELKEMFPQEYPETELEAFVSSGQTYFDKPALQHYINNIQPTIGMT